MLYNSIFMLILDIIIYFVVYVVCIPFLLVRIIDLLIEILKLRNKQNDSKLFIGSIIVSIILSIILSNNVNSFFSSTTTCINGKKCSDLRSIINQIVDFKEKETEIIHAKTNDINTYSETVVRRRLHHSSEYSYYYYLNIRDGEYIIPIVNNIAITELLYNGYFGEQVNFTNTIEVYKNTKYIKSINGIDIDDYENIKKFQNEKRYKIKIKINNEGYLNYETEGCTLDEYINNEDVCVAIYNKSKNSIKTTFQIYGTIENTFNGNLNINTLAKYCYSDGKYYVYVCERKTSKMVEPKSNVVELTVEKRKAIDFKIIEFQ